MHAGAGWGRAEEGRPRLKQGNATQEAQRQRGSIIRKEEENWLWTESSWKETLRIKEMLQIKYEESKVISL